MKLTALPAREPELRDQANVTADAHRRLLAAEHAIDAALQAVGELGAFVPQARLRLGVSGVVAQSVFDDAAEAVQNLTRARAAVVKVHNGMEAVRRRFNMPMMDAPEPKTTKSELEPPRRSAAA